MAIVLLLSIIALNSIILPRTSHAAVKYSYQVIEITGGYINDVQPRIDGAAVQGWELVTAPMWSQENSYYIRGLLIFRRSSE